MKLRLDRLLVLRGLAPTREKAQAMILAGAVTVDGRHAAKAGAPVAEDADVAVAGPPHPYVSRGGVKLAAALDAFGLDPSGRVCLDVGASTGGFTDCLLQRGAARVYAVDVGYGQLDARLRADPRVAVREMVNARALSREDVPERVALAAIDVSFISLRLVLPAVAALVEPGGAIVALVKPQFEAGRAEVPKGVVREVAEALLAAGGEVRGVIDSGLPGPKGNHEYVVHLVHSEQPELAPELDRWIADAAG
jgi:23S rRNA (cytidine1920-2'-O)/16S rRNA (cytidine1409-2'-O)-methyltransferase